MNYRPFTEYTPCKIAEQHCESCGSTDREDVDYFTNDGYSACCNEIIQSGTHGCRAHHDER